MSNACSSSSWWSVTRRRRAALLALTVLAMLALICRGIVGRLATAKREDLYFRRGADLLSSGHPALALPWLVRAQQLDRSDPTIRGMIGEARSATKPRVPR